MRRGWLVLFLPLLLAATGDVRPYLNTGPWYPSDPAELQKMLDGFFAGLPLPQKGMTVRGIIAPHAGYEYSGRCAAHAYRSLAPGQAIRRVILLGASHFSGFYGACVDGHAAYATPLGQVPVDAEICRALAAKKFFKIDRGMLRHEHALENQLPLLQKALGASGFSIVPILFGALEKKDFSAVAAAIAPYVDGLTLVVASSDLTHYGENFSYTPFRRDLRAGLTRLDQGFIDPVLGLDFDRFYAYREKTGITACGSVPIGILIRLLAGKNLRGTLADYRKSGDLNGDYSTSVSYAAMVFAAATQPAPDPTGLDAGEQEMLLKLARHVLQSHFSGPQPPPGREDAFAALPPRLLQNLGVFVTLRIKGELRGCIGSILGREPLCRGVAANAVHAAVDDPRFPPLRRDELDAVKIEISVMTPLRPVADHRNIRLGTDGVVIRDGSAQAVFLPQVATETGWTLDQFLGSLCLKAGLAHDAYRRSRTMQFHVFQAQVFSEREGSE